MSNSDWRDSNKSLSEKIKHIFQTFLYTDVVLVVCNGTEKKEFKVHELILRLASNVFDVALNGPFKESSTKTIEIHQIDPEIFNLFLEFIYFDKVLLTSVEQSIELYNVAHRYMTLPLKEFCLDYIRTSLDTSTACLGIEFAEFFIIEDLKLDCLEIIQERTECVVSNQNFLNATKETVITILSQDSLNIREIELFKAIEKWIRNMVSREGEQIKQDLCNTVVTKIRFLNMTPQEFTEGPVISGLLKDNQWPPILAHLASDECPLAFPEGFDRNYRCQFDHSNSNLSEYGRITPYRCNYGPTYHHNKKHLRKREYP
ncbi:kelch-like protein 30 [Cimex lectularius]|uniref:BTB domain-containing protein n=1 Tax=Cimex lectularius TaxID=79782 RepID=A0A8I6R9K1_CIMLE|nr:kelch-like protein 30 [Cimex lectularius]